MGNILNCNQFSNTVHYFCSDQSQTGLMLMKWFSTGYMMPFDTITKCVLVMDQEETTITVGSAFASYRLLHGIYEQ